MSALLIYFMFTAAPSCGTFGPETGCGRFQIHSIEHINAVGDGMKACRQLSGSLNRAFDSKYESLIGICVEDQEVGA